MTTTLTKPGNLTSEEQRTLSSILINLTTAAEVIALILEHGITQESMDALEEHLAPGPSGDRLTFSGCTQPGIFRDLQTALEGKCRVCNGLVHSTDPETMCECVPDPFEETVSPTLNAYIRNCPSVPEAAIRQVSRNHWEAGLHIRLMEEEQRRQEATKNLFEAGATMPARERWAHVYRIIRAAKHQYGDNWYEVISNILKTLSYPPGQYRGSVLQCGQRALLTRTELSITCHVDSRRSNLLTRNNVKNRPSYF